jgi:flagellar basal-body rod protein FlgB
MFDRTIDGLTTALNFRSLKHEIVLSNIANQNTPGYKAVKMDFEDQLHSAMIDHPNAPSTTHQNHFASVDDELQMIEPDVYKDPDARVSNDGNSVDAMQQQAKLAENQILYNATTQALRKKMGMLRYAITEGGR